MKKTLILCATIVLAGCDSNPVSSCWSIGVKNMVAKIYQDNRVPDATDIRVYDVVEEDADPSLVTCSAKIDYVLDDMPETVSVEYTVKTLKAEHGPVIRVQFTDIK